MQLYRIVKLFSFWEEFDYCNLQDAMSLEFSCQCNCPHGGCLGMGESKTLNGASVTRVSMKRPNILRN